MPPGADGAAGDDGAGVDVARAVRRQRLQGAQCRITELPAVAVRDGPVADVALARSEVARRALQEHARRMGRMFDHRAHGADVIGAESRVVPRQRRRMAGIVDDGRQDFSALAGDARNHHGVIGRAFRVEAADVLPMILIPVIALGRQCTAALTVNNGRRLDRLLRLLGELPDLRGDLVEVRPDQIAAGEMRARARHPAGAVRVRQRDLHLSRSQSRRLADGLAEVRHLDAVQDAVVHGDDQLAACSPSPPRVGLKPQQRRQQRPMHAGRLVVDGGAPHAMINADRRRDVAARDAGLAARLRCVNVFHDDPRLVFRSFGTGGRGP